MAQFTPVSPIGEGRGSWAEWFSFKSYVFPHASGEVCKISDASDHMFWLWLKIMCVQWRIQDNFSHIFYTGWPRKNVTLSINNFKKKRDRMKNLCALLCIEFFSEQDDTKIVNFDEGVLILWPFFWGNVIFEICPSISKVTIYVPNIFHCLASPGKLSALAL